MYRQRLYFYELQEDLSKDTYGIIFIAGLDGVGKSTILSETFKANCDIKTKWIDGKSDGALDSITSIESFCEVKQYIFIDNFTNIIGYELKAIPFISEYSRKNKGTTFIISGSSVEHMEELYNYNKDIYMNKYIYIPELEFLEYLYLTAVIDSYDCDIAPYEKEYIKFLEDSSNSLTSIIDSAYIDKLIFNSESIDCNNDREDNYSEKYDDLAVTVKDFLALVAIGKLIYAIDESCILYDNYDKDYLAQLVNMNSIRIKEKEERNNIFYREHGAVKIKAALKFLISNNILMRHKVRTSTPEYFTEKNRLIDRLSLNADEIRTTNSNICSDIECVRIDKLLVDLGLNFANTTFEFRMKDDLSSKEISIEQLKHKAIASINKTYLEMSN